MESIVRVGLVGVLMGAAVGFAGSVWAGESSGFAPVAPTTSYLYCIGSQPKHQLPDESMVGDAIFYSGVFSMTGTNLGPVGAAFQKFLEERHDFHAAPSLSQPITCMPRPTQAEAQAELDRNLARSQKYSHLQKVTDTGWTYGGASQ